MVNADEIEFSVQKTIKKGDFCHVTIRLKCMRSILKEFYDDWVAGYIDQAIQVSSTL